MAKKSAKKAPDEILIRSVKLNSTRYLGQQIAQAEKKVDSSTCKYFIRRKEGTQRVYK